MFPKGRVPWLGACARYNVNQLEAGVRHLQTADCRLQTFKLNITSPFPFPKANRKQANLSAIQANLSAIHANLTELQANQSAI